MSDDGDETGTRIPEDEGDVIDVLEEEKGRELTEREKNLAVAQAKLIGDL